MVAFKIDTFGGMVPAVSDELLPEAAAAHSENAWLYTGSLVGLPTPKNLKKLLIADSSKVYRIPETYNRSTYIYNSLWLEFTNVDTDVIRAPVFDDTYDRYYYASTSLPPRYNTRARIKAGAEGKADSRSWLLGVPPPTIAPELVVTGGSIRASNVRVATTVNGVIDKDFVAGKTVDGVVLKADDRIFIKNQTGAGATDNGIRIVEATGTPPRASDMNTANEFVGKFFKVLEGTVNGGSTWKISNETDPVLGADKITSKEVPAIPLEVTRAYVYTWVTEYKEESAPSPPVVVTGMQDGTWELSGLEIPSALNRGYAVNHSAERWITKTRIYRTITSSSGVATFFFVAEQACTRAFYNDKLKDDDVSSNAQLESFSWTPPPEDLKGLVVMWNGIVAGWRANELWMCEPYRPHAWPSNYVMTMEYPIVGLGVSGQTLVVCTVGYPTTVHGSLPDNMTSAKVSAFFPCTSRGSILSSAAGVLYVSPEGLVLCNQQGAVSITKDLVTRDKWRQYAGEARLRAAWLGGGAYYAFGGVTPGAFELTAWAGSHNDFVKMETGTSPGSGFSSGFSSGFGGNSIIALVPMPDWISKLDTKGARNGILIDPTNQRIGFNLLTSELPVMGVQNDPWSGEVFLIRDGRVQWLDISDLKSSIEPSIWRSKIYQTQDKKNFAAMRIYFRETVELPELDEVRITTPQEKLGPKQWGLCRFYADGRLVYTQELRTSGELWRLPSGFLADFWQYEVETRLKILSIQLATSVKELASR